MTRTLIGAGLAAVMLGTPPAATAGSVQDPRPATPLEVVELPIAGSPIVDFRILISAGAIHDPEGKEGLAALTGLMVGQSGTAKRTYTELTERLYPLAAFFRVQTDREVTVIVGRSHRETLSEYVGLLKEVLLEPGFREEDLTRHREQLRGYLTTLQSASDEQLGLEALQQQIFEGHPYGHSPAGTYAGLSSITMEDVKAFYREHYTQAGLTLGVAGGYPEELVAELRTALEELPAGSSDPMPLPEPPTIEGRRVTLLEKETDAIGIHFGHPLPVNRADPDFYPLMVANSFLGEHRTFHGRLMQQLRGLRGLNYGDYSYIEYWDNPPGTTSPEPNVPRRQQYFSVWIRPVVPATANFALRAGLFEVQRLIGEGLTPAEFELTRDYLVNYSKLWAQTATARLGFLIDSRYYGMPYFIDEIEARLRKLSVDEVNRAARKYLQTDDLEIVMVLNGAEQMQKALAAPKAEPATYASPVPPEVAEADERMAVVPIDPARVDIVLVGELFQK